MTVEHKITVNLNDIKAIVFECRKCHARIAIPAAEVKVPYACTCGQQWRPDYQENVPTPKWPYERFCTAFKQCRTLQDNDAMFTMFLEFDAQGLDVLARASRAKEN
jgi:hypothetical protein